MWECEWNKIKNNLDNKSEIEENTKHQNINVRDALFGGRTEAFKSYFKCNEHQKIGYDDVVSLYPTVNALDDYAVGFKKYVNTTSDDIQSGKFCGLVKVDITPPKNLYVPILPDNSNHKLLFHLNEMKEKTWASAELKVALDNGYTITKIHAALEYDKYTGLMKEYVGHFYEMKQKNSGVKSQEECDKINKSHKDLGFSFEIKPEDTANNPGLRQLAKICLNSLWGKFGQRSNLSSYDFFYDYNKLLLKLNETSTVSKQWHIINKNCVELKYEENIDMNIEADYISEITAVFTTANARMRLYKMLSWLHPSQILYCDTDSVIYVYDETNPEHKYRTNDQPNLPNGLRFGDALGEWESEMKEGEWITEFVSGGAKSYCYTTNKGKIVVKQKGITLDLANCKKVNFDTMKDMILNNTEIKSEPRFQFRWDTVSKDIITKHIGRSIRSTIKEKRTIDGYDSLPFGYEKRINI
jgi:hypothetical protein